MTNPVIDWSLMLFETIVFASVFYFLMDWSRLMVAKMVAQGKIAPSVMPKRIPLWIIIAFVALPFLSGLNIIFSGKLGILGWSMSKAVYMFFIHPLIVATVAYIRR
jgi:hypothetical protein